MEEVAAQCLGINYAAVALQTPVSASLTSLTCILNASHHSYFEKGHSVVTDGIERLAWWSLFLPCPAAECNQGVWVLRKEVITHCVMHRKITVASSALISPLPTEVKT